jgi:hypothetical protein
LLPCGEIFSLEKTLFFICQNQILYVENFAKTHPKQKQIRGLGPQPNISSFAPYDVIL